MLTKFELLVKNPSLASYTNHYINSNMLNMSLGYTFSLPHKADLELPFIFSCFALSIDGKLCYMDNQSGFNIAKCNASANANERQGDLDYLMIARTIADAIIIGSNSLNLEQGNYTTSIINASLAKERTLLAKHSTNPLAIIICRDLTKLNFKDKLLISEEFSVLICCTKQDIDLSLLPANYNVVTLTEISTMTTDKIKQKNVIVGSELIEILPSLKALGINIILNESPYVHHYLLETKVLDEIWLNYSFCYIGGNATSLGMNQTPFTSTNHPETTILTLHSLGYNFIYTRQRVVYK